MIFFRNRGRWLTVLSTLATMLSMGSVWGQMPVSPPSTARALPTGVREFVDLAYLLADGEPTPLNLDMFFASLYGVPFDQSLLAELAKERKVIAVKAFDDLYYVGFNTVGTWTLKTPAGLILWDTLDSSEEARDVLIPGLKKLGLDPGTIKYVIVTHAHFDHYGGALYLQETYHPHILMSPADWNMMSSQYRLSVERGAAHAPASGRKLPAPPAHDRDVKDGEVLTLGGVSVTLYITPGHTPGTVSSIVPTSFNGQRHVAEFLGGTAAPNDLQPSAVNGGLLAYRDAIYRFSKIALAQHVDSIISNHPVVDGTIEKAEISRALKPDQISPWVLGESTVLRVNGAQIAALEAYIAAAGQKQRARP